MLFSWHSMDQSQKVLYSERTTVLSTARRRIYMTYQCEFGLGTFGHIPIATGTTIFVRRWLKLPGCKTAGRIERERVSAPLDRIWESRAGCMHAKAILHSQEAQWNAASPVSWRWHAVKAMYPNPGDLAVSTNMPRKVVE